MIVVNVRRSAEKAVTAEQVRAAAEEAWVIADDALDRYGDRVVAVRRNVVVGAYIVRGWTRRPDGRVIFDLEPGADLADMIGAPSPVTWRRGQSNPVAFVDDTSGTVSAAVSRRVRPPASARRRTHRITIETRDLGDKAAADLHHALLVVASMTGKLHDYRTTSLVREMEEAKSRRDFEYHSASSPKAISG